MNNTSFYDMTPCVLIESHRSLRQIPFLHLNDMGEIFYVHVYGIGGGWDSLVGIVTCCGLVVPGIESWYGEIFHADYNSLQSGHRVLSRGKAAEWLRAILPPPFCACIGMSWCDVYLYLYLYLYH